MPKAGKFQVSISLRLLFLLLRGLMVMAVRRSASVKMVVPATQSLEPASVHQEFKARAVKTDVPQVTHSFSSSSCRTAQLRLAAQRTECKFH